MRSVADFFRRWFGRPGNPPDPYAYIGVPKRRGPQDRAGAVALEEPPA